MANADGSVIVIGKFNSKGVKAGVAESDKVLNGLAVSARRVSKKINDSLSSAFASNAQPETNQYKGVTAQIRSLKTELAEAEAQKRKLEDSPLRNAADARNIEQLSDRINELKANIANAKGERDELVQSGAWSGLGGAVRKIANDIVTAFRLLPQAASKGIKSILGWVGRLTVAMGKLAITAATTTAKALGKLASGVLKKLGNGFKLAAKGVVNFLNPFKKANKSMSGGIKNVLKYAIGIRSLFVLFNKLRSAVKDGLDNLVQFSDVANKSVSAITSSLTRLKNSLATAFAPILKVVAPMLSVLIDKLSEAATAAGMFFAAMTEQKTFTKAVAVQEDYAKSLGDTADAAKKANKYLSGLDEIRTFTDDSEADNGKAKPSEMFEEVEVPNMFKNLAERIKEAFASADLTELGANLAQRISNALSNIPWEDIKAKLQNIALSISTFLNGLLGSADLWTAIGAAFGEGVNTVVGAIYTLMTSVDWVGIGSALASGINRLVTIVDWEQLSKVLFANIFIITSVLSGFVQTIDWNAIGSSLATGVNGLFESIDWAMVGTMISNGILGLIGLITTFIEETDWQMIGNKIAEFLGAIDWNGIVDALMYGIGAACAGLALLLWGIIEDAWGAVVDWWNASMEKAGGNVINGLLIGLGDALIGIGAWIYDHIFKPFMDGFCKLFGIHSPSTVMAEQGGFIISGLLGGLKDKFSDVISWLASLPTKFLQVASKIWLAIQAPFANIATWFKDKFSAAWQKVKDVFSKGGQVFSGIKDGILEGLKAVINTLIKGINSVISIPFEGLNTALNKLKGIEILGFKPFDWISTIGVPQIPYLAKGAVIPPNAPFAAVLGDQRHGTNIEAPLSTIEDAVRNVLAERGNSQGFNGTIRIPVVLDGRQIYEAVVNQAQLAGGRSGRVAFDFG